MQKSIIDLIVGIPSNKKDMEYHHTYYTLCGHGNYYYYYSQEMGKMFLVYDINFDVSDPLCLELKKHFNFTFLDRFQPISAVKVQ